jgi:hypothetical protein
MAADIIVREDGADDFPAEAAPGTRFALIREKQAQSRMAAMMGTATSDTPALAQPDADAGITMNAGATAAKAATSMPARLQNHEADPRVRPAARCWGIRVAGSRGWPGLVPEDLLRGQWPVPERPRKPGAP